ncbi:MAG: ABC transporter permease [Granulosicoccus sp.]
MSTNSQAVNLSTTDEASELLASDGRTLKQSLARALRREKLRALALVSPLLLFIIISFVLPIGDMLFRSVENSIVEETLPGTVRALSALDANTDELPEESVYAALADDMMLAQELKIHTRLGSRLNYDQPGISSVFRKSGRRIKRMDNSASQQAFIALNPAWETPGAWQSLAAFSNFAQDFPATQQSLANWRNWYASEEGTDTDPSTVAPHGFTYASLYHDLARLDAQRLIELDSHPSGLFNGISTTIAGFPNDDFKTQFADIDEGWVELDNWQAIKRLSPTIVDSYFLASVDAERNDSGVELKPDNERIYLLLFWRTLLMSLIITCSCILLGYPVAYLLANLSVKASNLVLILVLLPFWTSLLVRTSAWKVLLQQQGVINDLLVWVGIIDEAGRLVMINNMTGTIIAMTHILLPFMILPLYSVMKTIPPSYMRAAKSMGASDSLAFWRIYFPNTVPGIGAGSILVFILSIGYYITPELVGGTSGVFISNRIAYHISSSLNWGLAAALGTILLLLVLALYWTYDRIVGIDNVKLG